MGGPVGNGIVHDANGRGHDLRQATESQLKSALHLSVLISRVGFSKWNVAAMSDPTFDSSTGALLLLPAPDREEARTRGLPRRISHWSTR
jgi:hypothetical protein